MATLKIFKRPTGFELPESYTRNVRDNDNVAFIKKVDSDVEGYKKYIVGRHFKKESKIFKPKEKDIEEQNISYDKSITCFVYVPMSQSDNQVFLVGAESNTLLSEVLSFAKVTSIKNEIIDIKALEKNSLKSGNIGLMGHKYNTSNDTVSYTVRKIDGAPFRRNDPEFVSYDEAEKEALQVRLELNEENPCFHVYADGTITRSGITDYDTSEFDLLLTVYKIIRRETS